MGEQLQRILTASETAQEKLDYDVAHNESTLYAIEIVEEFLRKKHRICYGGQAINAHLPSKHKIYNPEKTLPDYDFFTPSQYSDTRLLVQDLKKAGFTEIAVREGIHEGTIKIYVDYIPIADITDIDPTLYRVLSKREYRVDGISYMDLNTLRMLMYLELSRPRGQVGRWPKVYERLMLLNTISPPSSSRCHRVSPLRHSMPKEKVGRTIRWLIENERIFAGLDLVELYRDALQSSRAPLEVEWLVRAHKPILFYSSEPESDAKQLQEFFEDMDKNDKGDKQESKPVYKIKTEFKERTGDILPRLTILYNRKTPLLFIVHQTACHSYFQLPLRHKSHESLRIASVDTLITLYFSLGLVNSAFLDMRSMECLANQLVHISSRLRANPKKSAFPFISLNCTGHQTTFRSLVRSKAKRMTERKKVLAEILQEDVSLIPLQARNITRKKKVQKTQKTQRQ